MVSPEETLPPPANYTIPGLRIQKNIDSGPWELTIRATERQTEWTIFREKKHYEPMVMDTTIHYEGRFYRIHEEEESAGGWIYRLNVRPPGEIMHKIVELTAEKVAEVQTEKKELDRMMTLNTISIYYEIFLGFLPARIQNNLAERLHFSPEDASRKNALLEFFFFFGCTALATILIFAVKSTFFLLMGFGILGLALEGFVRWGHILASNEPLGLYILEVLDRIWQISKTLIPTRRK